MSAPIVAIVITSYLKETKPYLDLCMRSIANLDYPLESLKTVIVAPTGYAPRYENADTVCPGEPLNYSNSHAINVGVSFALSHLSAEFVVYANDDVIFTRDSLKNLVTIAIEAPKLLLMPISNDQQGRYWALTERQGPYRLESIENQADLLMAARSQYPPGLFFFDSLCTYVMLFSRELWHDVGPLDESFVNTGPDDIDWTLRARAKGYQPAISLDALVWHAGGVSADITMTPEMRELNARAFANKWAK